MKQESGERMGRRMKDYLSRITILYVDNNEVLRECMGQALSRRVKEIYFAENGRLGIDSYKQNKPNIVVTDIRMPVLDGLGMAAELKKIDKSLPIVVTTAYNDEAYFMRSIEIGVDGYLKVPINYKKLLELLGGIAERICLQEELAHARELLEEDYRIINEDMEMAASFQRKLLPGREKLRGEERVDLSFLMKPGGRVSGDFLIVEYLDENHLVVFTIDVMGHGISAGLGTIEIKTLFEQEKQRAYEPRRFLQLINEKATSVSTNAIFLTATFLLYEFSSGTAVIASGGGVPVVHYRSETKKGTPILIEGDPLAVYKGEEFCVSEREVKMGRNDFIVVQTDGILETSNLAGERFDGLCSQHKIINSIRSDKTSRQVIEDIVSLVDDFKGESREPDDDITISVLKSL